MKKKLPTVEELSVAVAQEAQEKPWEGQIKLLVLDTVLPPPIYGDTLTVIPENVSRTTKLVGGIIKKKVGEVPVVEVQQGELKYTVPLPSIKYWIED